MLKLRLKQKMKRARDCFRMYIKKGVFYPIDCAPFFESDVTFEFPDHISIGSKVVFMKGCVVSANGGGKIILNDEASICRFSIIQAFGGIVEIGARTSIGDFCNLYGFRGGLKIGDDVLMASGCRVIPSSHDIEYSDDQIRTSGMTSKGIKIGDGSWLGSNVVVVDGVNIGRGAVIGAGAVVRKDVPDFAVYAGVPAKLIRMRSRKNI